jgi:hypothetical protein
MVHNLRRKGSINSSKQAEYIGINQAFMRQVDQNRAISFDGVIDCILITFGMQIVEFVG